MSRFSVGDIVYPEFYPEQKTRCTVTAVDAPCPDGCGLDVLIVETEDGRQLYEIDEAFLKAGERRGDVFKLLYCAEGQEKMAEEHLNYVAGGGDDE